MRFVSDVKFTDVRENRISAIGANGRSYVANG